MAREHPNNSQLSMGISKELSCNVREGSFYLPSRGGTRRSIAGKEMVAEKLEKK
jgi:hypothetical protein